jgi:hypothetical protein
VKRERRGRRLRAAATATGRRCRGSSGARPASNSLFEGELTDADLINYAHHVRDKMLESDVLAQQAATNSKEQFALGDFHDVMMDAVIEGLDNYQSMADQVLNNEQVRRGFASLLLDLVYQAFQQHPPLFGKDFIVLGRTLLFWERLYCSQTTVLRIKTAQI